MKAEGLISDNKILCALPMRRITVLIESPEGVSEEVSLEKVARGDRLALRLCTGGKLGTGVRATVLSENQRSMCVGSSQPFIKRREFALLWFIQLAGTHEQSPGRAAANGSIREHVHGAN